MKLIYENSLGRIYMHGGKGTDFNITDISGLSFPDIEATTVRYPGVAGQAVTQISHLARTITISGDLKDKGGSFVSRVVTILSEPGVLNVFSGSRHRKINCRCTNFEPKKRQGIYVPFVMQLVSDNPYFEDISTNREAILKKEKLIKGTITLPIVFSQRITEGRIINRGSFKNEPIYKITAADYAACPDGIIITNCTTGNSITLYTDILAGEVISVDVENRKITSNLRGNLLGALSSDSLLSEMYLKIGINDFSVTANNEPQLLFIECLYTNKYVEAVL